MQQYEDIYSLQNYFAVNKYLHTVASVGFLFTFNIAFFPEGYCSHSFNCLGYITKYADSGIRPNVVCFRRLLLAHVQLPWLRKEICRQWDSTQRSVFLKATPSTRSSALAT